MKRNCIRGLLLATLLIGLPALKTAAAEVAPAAQIVVISHKNVTDELKKGDLEQIFLGKKTRWADDAKIVFVILGEKATCAVFLKNYVSKTLDQYTNYWKKQVFTGKGRMPEVFATSQEVMQHVAATAGAIGFVPAQDADPNLVKVLTLAP